MKNYAILLSYVGTDFCGWQMQGEASGPKPSIQATLENVLFQMTQERPTLVASGRTDAGVHAAGQVVNFRLEKKPLPEYNLLRGMNTLLPPAIRVLQVREVPLSFHAQHDALRKQYSYYYQLGPAPAAHLLPYTTFSHQMPDLALMADEASKLVGEHDFLAFQGSGAKPGPTVREIYEAEVTLVHPGPPLYSPLNDLQLLRIRVIGSGFLKHMVRSIAGTLFEIGCGARAPSMQKLLDTRDRTLIGPTAEAQGLWLERLWYPELSFDRKNTPITPV